MAQVCPTCFSNLVAGKCPHCGTTPTPVEAENPFDQPAMLGHIAKHGKSDAVGKIELCKALQWWTLPIFQDAQTPRSTPQDQWDRLFMGIAKNIAAMSKCASRKIGAVVVRDRQILSMGYNGSPAGSTLCQNAKICPRKQLGYKSGEGIELCPAAHAERNAVSNAAKNGVAISKATLYCYCGLPCQACAGALINAGIVKVVCLKYEEHYDKLAERLFSEAEVEIQYLTM